MYNFKDLRNTLYNNEPRRLKRERNWLFMFYFLLLAIFVFNQGVYLANRNFNEFNDDTLDFIGFFENAMFKARTNFNDTRSLASNYGDCILDLNTSNYTNVSQYIPFLYNTATTTKRLSSIGIVSTVFFDLRLEDLRSNWEDNVEVSLQTFMWLFYVVPIVVVILSLGADWLNDTGSFKGATGKYSNSL